MRQDIPDVSVVVFFQVLLQKGNRGELLINFAVLAVDFNEALVLVEFLENRTAVVGGVEDVCELFVGEDVGLELVEGGDGVGDDDGLEGELGGQKGTLQMGH
jgi:hypothetical protein